MSEAAVRLRAKVRNSLQSLQATPLHPQWLAHRLRGQRDRWLATRAQGDVLDIGCADGAIRNALPGLRSYLGLDYPGTALGLYGTRPDVLGDAASLPFSDARFDTVMLLDVLEHLARPELALAEARRVLRPGGRLLVTVPFAYPLHDMPHDYQRFTAPGLRHRLAGAGLEDATIDEAGGGIEAAALEGCLALAQGALEAIAARRWAVVLVPAVIVLVPMLNLTGWLLSRLLPVSGLLPGAYFVQAERL